MGNPFYLRGFEAFDVSGLAQVVDQLFCDETCVSANANINVFGQAKSALVDIHLKVEGNQIS